VPSIGINAVNHTIPSNNTRIGLTLNAYVCSCSTPSFSSLANSTPTTSSVIFQSCKFSYPNLVYSGDHLQNLIRCFLHEGKYFLNFMTVHPRFQKSFGQTDRMIIPSTSLLRRCNELPEQRRIAVYLETHCPVDYFTVDTLRCRRGTARRCVHLGVICHQLPRSVCTPNLRHLLSPTPKTEGLRSIKRSRDHDRDPFGCK